MNHLTEKNTNELFENFNICINDIANFQTDRFKYLISLIDELKSINQSLHNKINDDTKKIEMIDDYKKNIQKLKDDNQSLIDEITNLKKVSVVSNLNKQLHEKNSIIEQQNRQIEILKKQISPKNTWNVDTSYISLKINSDVDKSIQIQDNLEDVKNNIVLVQEEKDIIDDNNEKSINEKEVIDDYEDETHIDNTEDYENDVAIDNNDETEDDENEDDIEIEYEVVKIGKKYYYRSNEDINGIYEVIKPSNDIGKKLGIYENNKPKWL